jgi:PncC family amidohydrolase
MESLRRVAARLAESLQARQRKIVFAESCTAGLAAAMLATIPGVSAWHCGSAVTYREQTKIDWLGVDPKLVAKFGVVSGQVAEGMARGVLQRTREADLSAAITGHLGPQAPDQLDGVVFVAVVRREDGEAVPANVWRISLTATEREPRQRESALHLLTRAHEVLMESN